MEKHTDKPAEKPVASHLHQVGDHLWFYQCNQPVEAEPLAAIVAKCNGDETVNLGYFDCEGKVGSACNVPVLKDMKERPEDCMVFACPVGMKYKAPAPEHKGHK